ncbi:MAG: HAD family hydrolase [Firmicutes bacterium]|nr:HAD family hydrolase [Bacillota bacterium]
MNTIYKYILFDLDGTLTDSAEGVTRSVSYALSKYGIKTNPADLKTFIGPPLQLSFRQVYGFSEEKAREAVEYYRDYYREKGIFENRLYPGIKDMLKRLSEKDIKLFVATSKPTLFAKKILDYYEVGRYFELIIGSNLDGTRVDKTEVIQAVFEKAEIPDKNLAVMVGDREHDLIGAQKHNLDSIAVSYGYGTLEELKAANPTAIAHSVEELSSKLLKKFLVS